MRRRQAPGGATAGSPRVDGRAHAHYEEQRSASHLARGSIAPEVPGANGQGRTKEEARESLIEAISFILEDRREDGLRGVPEEAKRETIFVEVRGAT